MHHPCLLGPLNYRGFKVSTSMHNNLVAMYRFNILVTIMTQCSTKSTPADDSVPWLDLPDVAAELPGVWASDTGNVYASVSNPSAGDASDPRSTRAQLLQRAIKLRSRVIKSGDCIKICSALQLAATSAHIFKIEIHTGVFQCLCHFAIDLCRMMSLTEKLCTVIEEILPWASLAAVP